jgi:hypothetical protein
LRTKGKNNAPLPCLSMRIAHAHVSSDGLLFLRMHTSVVCLFDMHLFCVCVYEYAAHAKGTMSDEQQETQQEPARAPPLSAPHRGQSTGEGHNGALRCRGPTLARARRPRAGSLPAVQAARPWTGPGGGKAPLAREGSCAEDRTLLALNGRGITQVFNASASGTWKSIPADQRV